jgi:phage shock protein PspC (stress-responsive transcriptional regulator)
MIIIIYFICIFEVFHHYILFSASRLAMKKRLHNTRRLRPSHFFQRPKAGKRRFLGVAVGLAERQQPNPLLCKVLVIEGVVMHSFVGL